MAILLKIVGPFHLHEEIHAANGILVYYATDTRTGEHKLVYVLDQEPGLETPQVQRLAEIVATTRQLQHPNILSFDQWGEIDGYHFAATQPLVGLPLTHELSQYGVRFSFETTSLVVQQVADALDFAAERGWLHGALSPADIWLNRHGSVQLSGFGLAALLGTPKEPAPSAIEQNGGNGAPDLTPYVAPEQVLQDGVNDRRTDVYSLSAVAYTLLVGQPPFVGDGRTLREQIIHHPPPPLEQLAPDVPRLAGTIVQFGLAKEPGGRYATAGEFARAFAQTPLARPAIRPMAQLGGIGRLGALFGFGGFMRSRYGLRVALPLLFIALLTGTLLISRSLSNALPSRDDSGAQQEMAQLDEAQPDAAHPREAGAVALDAVAVEPMTGAAPPAADQTAPVLEPPINEELADEAAPNAGEASEIGSPIEPNSGAPEPLAAALPEAEAVAAATNQALVEDNSRTAVEVEPAGEAVAATTPGAIQEVAPTIPALVQQWGPVLRLVSDQLLVGVGALAVPVPAQDEPVAEVVETLDPPPADQPATDLLPSEPPATEPSISEPPITEPPITDPPSAELPSAEVEEDAPVALTNDGALHLPLVLQSIYAEGTVNVTANLRAGPSTSYGIMGIAQPGQRVTLVACSVNCSWYQLASGEWIAAFLVNLVAEPAQPLPLATPTPPTD